MAVPGAEWAETDTSMGRIERFVHSRVFSNLFAHGMELVEETATYLDHGGRKAAKSLSREAAMTYAGVSMRLTTRLMQVASWLLVLRAVRDGEMQGAEALEEKYRLISPNGGEGDSDIAGLPEPLEDLIEQTNTLYARISRLDHDLFVAGDPERAIDGDAQGRLRALEKAFQS